MARDEDSFHIRPGNVRDQKVPRAQRVVRPRPALFIHQLQQAIRRAGGDINRLAETGSGAGRCNARGRGARVAAELKGPNGWARDAGGVRSRSLRVAVKARIVKLNPQRGTARGRQFVSANAIAAHLRYLERVSVTRDGAKGQAYSDDKDIADGPAFLDRGRDDRHQFRFIVSAEEGAELADLRATTRGLMAQMEADLGTKLDWIAVDHHNTGHPHTHVLMRGVTDDGKMLNIAGDYIAHGIRMRASEIVTLELGRQTEQDVARQLASEVDADRFTRLDRMLIAEQQAGNAFADLRPDKDMLDMFRRNRALLIARAHTLERMGLATEHTPGVWTISTRAEPVLRELGIRSDIIKTMHHALQREGLAAERSAAAYVLHGTTPAQRIIGRVVGKGLGGDELGERFGLVIDGVDGKIHHIELAASSVEDIRTGAIVEVAPTSNKPRPADRNILSVTDEHGIYRPSEHLQVAREQADHIRADPETFVKMHIRRLEALRRAGIVERVHADHWIIPANLPERGLTYDRQRLGGGPRLNELSHLPLERQVRHEGPTWLDRTMLANKDDTLSPSGFGGDVHEAWNNRMRALADMGYLEDSGGGRYRAPGNLRDQLEHAEIDRAGRAFAAKRGIAWRPTEEGGHVAGTLVGRAQLSSGQFAMIADGFGFQLVPWSDSLEPRRGREISGIAMAGGGIDWRFERERGLGL